MKRRTGTLTATVLLPGGSAATETDEQSVKISWPSVLVWDRHALSRGSFVAALSRAGVPTTTDPLEPTPEVALVVMHSAEDLPIIRELADANGHMSVVVVSMGRNSQELLLEAIAAGATAVVSQESTVEVLALAAWGASQGFSQLPTDVMRRAVSNASTSCLAPTERAWLEHLQHGMTVAQIANKAGYSERSMYRLLAALYARLGVSGRFEALELASCSGWLAS